MNKFQKDWWLVAAGIMVSAVAYYLLGYQVSRQNFPVVLLLFSLTFAAYAFLARKLPLKTGTWTGIFFRLLFLFSLPALSDDYFRFLWDGRLFAAGENPFLHLPDH
jgi:alpha-1,6-mannosyltransferase